jgi:predicted phosphodiesterase
MKKQLIPAFMLLTICLFYRPGFTQKITFGIVTDVHFAAIPDNGSRTYSQSLAKLQECVDTMNRYKVDFLIELGDFKDMSQPPDEQKTLTYLEQVEGVYQKFSGPLYHVLGNHDEDCISKEQFFSVAHSRGIDKEKSYYSYNSGGFHFVVLDANFDSAGNNFDHGSFDWGDSNVPDIELLWLKEDLSKSDNPVIVFIHQLLDGSEPYQVNNAAQIRTILENSGNVKCVFQGHYHEGNYSEINGICYYTLRGLIDGQKPEGNSYAIVQLTTDSIIIKGFRNAESMTLSY